MSSNTRNAGQDTNWAGRFNALAWEALPAFEFFLTLLFRLRVAERILSEMRDPIWKHHQDRVRQALQRIRPDFWLILQDTAKTLRLYGFIDLNFPQLVRAAAAS